MKRLIVGTLCYTLSIHYASAQSFEQNAERVQQYSVNQTNQNGYQTSEVRYVPTGESNAVKPEGSRVVYNDLHGSDLKF